MLVLMAGLPGSGKSTLSRALAGRLNAQRSGCAVVLDKDELRAHLFLPDKIEYSRQQDDTVMSVLYARAAQVLAAGPRTTIFIDGRPFSRTYQIDEAIAQAERMQTQWRILECICSEASAQTRLVKAHLASDRDYALHQRIASEWQPITRPKLAIDTDQPLAMCVEQGLAYLRQ
jgi:predicted kinase